MQQARHHADRAPRVPGIIDTIAAAMSAVVARPILLIIPVLFDLYLWLGVRVSPQALTTALRHVVLETGSGDKTQIADNLRTMGQSSDVTSLVSLLVPSIVAGIDRAKVVQVWARGSYAPGSWWLVCLVALALMLVGAALSMLYRVPMALTVRGVSAPVREIMRATLKAWVRFVALVALVVGLCLLIGGPALIIAGLFELAGVNIVPLLTLFLLLPAAWAAVYLYFAIDAIVVSEVGPLRAIYLSFNVARRNFWQTVGFAFVTILISAGLTQIWILFLRTTPGLLFAILANAFVSTGLAMASMMFYFDRLRRWRGEPLSPLGLTAATRVGRHG